MIIPAICLLGLMGIVPYKDYPEAKIGLFSLFCLAQGVGLYPVIAAGSIEGIVGTTMTTGCTMGSLGAVIYSAPSENFLNYNLPQALACGAAIGVATASIAFPATRAVSHKLQWIGLSLFSAFLIYDVKVCLGKIEHEDEQYDPVACTLYLGVDFPNMVRRFCGNSVKEKSDENKKDEKEK